jgi:hypothetical protein
MVPPLTPGVPAMSDDVEAIVRGLSEGERARLAFGRRDWRDNAWQDHCGDIECEHCSGLSPDPEPHRLSQRDQAVRQSLLSSPVKE